MKKNLLYSILLSIVALGCGVVSSDNNVQKEVNIKYYLCDSTGTEKTVFKVGESIFGGYVLKNISSKPIHYLMSENIKLGIYVIIQKAADNDIVGDESIPPSWVSFVNKVILPGDTLVEKYEIVNKNLSNYFKEPGNYKASFNLHYKFDNEIRKHLDENNVIYYKIIGD